MPDQFACIELQSDPQIAVAVIPGSWLLTRATPSWRITDPELGFQRMVNEERARVIAAAVLDQQRSFPNAIVLATDSAKIDLVEATITFPRKVRFLVVDGQHRLWAQKYSSFEAPYSCIIHFGLDEREMAELFVEINDNQKRVPSSLRWDLVRLVRSEEDPAAVRAADIVYELATTDGSPLHQRIDLTGEQSAISLKQGSVAPAVKALLAGPRSPLRDLGFDVQLKIVKNFVAALRECDADGWDGGSSPFYSARVFRAAFRLAPEIIKAVEKPPERLTARDFLRFLSKIDLGTLDLEDIRAQQGDAGVKAIYETLREQVFPGK